MILLLSLDPCLQCNQARGTDHVRRFDEGDPRPAGLSRSDSCAHWPGNGKLDKAAAERESDCGRPTAIPL